MNLRNPDPFPYRSPRMLVIGLYFLLEELFGETGSQILKYGGSTE